jgi:hypothetical protein
VAVARAAEFKTRQPVNTDDVASTLNLTEDQGYDMRRSV